MAERILDGTLSKQQYEYKKNYPNQGGNIYFNTYQIYNRSIDRSGVIDQGTLKTYLLVLKNGEWYKGAELKEDGKWYALSEKESGILVPNSDPSKPGTFKPIPNASDNKILGDVVIRDLNAGGTKSLRYQAINNAKFQLKKGGGLSNDQVNAEFDISKNINPPGEPGTPGLLGPPIAADQPTPPPPQQELKQEDLQAIEDDLGKLTKGTRTEYEKDLRYPENLQLNQQDCIKFTVFEYKPRGLSLSPDPNRRRLQGKDSKGSIILPIPGGISDSNTVDWTKDDLDLAATGIANLVTGFVSQGTAGASAAANDIQRALSQTGQETLAKIVAVKTAQSVMGANVLSRGYGGVLNPNSELLFTGPQLRTFTFTFRLSPRSSSEAILVRKIIRTFKQSMSVQRTESAFLLKAPNTFGIEYLTTGGQHPYLTKFKECALTQCNVNYTPDGTYMTYAGEPSMTAYELQLTFQELEPVFNDDYGNDYDNVGY